MHCIIAAHCIALHPGSMLLLGLCRGCSGACSLSQGALDSASAPLTACCAALCCAVLCCAVLQGKTAAVFVEPIQGEGGINPGGWLGGWWVGGCAREDFNL